MIGFLADLGAPKAKAVAQVKPARPDPKVQQAKNQINAQIKQVENLLATVPNAEYAQYLTCLRNRLNDISIVCNEPTTPIAKVRQMYNQAQAAAKKDAAITKREEKRAVVAEKKEERQAAKKAKRLANGKTISIDPKEESAVNAIESTIVKQIQQTDKQIADTKKKIAEVKARLARSGKKAPRLGNLYVGPSGMGGLGIIIGGKDFDCSKKKNAVVCALNEQFTQLTTQTQDQLIGLVDTLAQKQSELESLLADLTALMATMPTADEIASKVIEATPTPASAEEIGSAVSTAITESLTTIMPPTQPPSGGYYIDPYSGQPTYPTPTSMPVIQDLPVIQDEFTNPFGGEEIQTAKSQPSFYSEPQTGRATVFLDTETAAPIDSNLGPLPNMDDLLNDFGDVYYERDEYNEGLFGLGCNGNKKCGCGS